MSFNCVICKKDFEGFGNNAEPYKIGRCCDKCNDLVISYRIQLATNPKFPEFERSIKLIYAELDEKFNYYNLHKDEIESSDDVFEQIKCYCSLKSKEYEHLVNQKEVDLFSDKFDKNDIFTEYTKIKVESLPILDISKEVMELMETNNQIYPRKLPYDRFAVFFPKDSILLSVKIPIYIVGIVVIANPSLQYFQDYAQNDLEKVIAVRIIIKNYVGDDDKYKIVTMKLDKKTWNIDFSSLEIINDDKKAVNIFHKAFQRVMQYFVNILDYMNHPQSVITIHKHSSNNSVRISKGKTPMNDKVEIRVGGKLLRYIYDNKKKTEGLKHKVLIRGHYYSFRNKDWFKRIYNMKDEELQTKGYINRLDGLIAVWILPMWKGSGEILNKRKVLK